MKAILKTVVYELKDLGRVEREILRELDKGWVCVSRTDVILKELDKPFRITMIFEPIRYPVGVVCITKRKYKEWIHHHGRSNLEYVCIMKVDDLKGLCFSRIECTEEQIMCDILIAARERIR